MRRRTPRSPRREEPAINEVEETMLPGVGVRHDFSTRHGNRLGVISHRAGRRELLVYDEEDPDACRETVWLDEDEGHRLAEMLGGSAVNEHLGRMAQEIEGLAIDWVEVRATSDCVDASLTDAGVRREMGATVVAVQRGENGEEIVPAPTADFVLRAGDVAVIVGTPDGVDTLAARLRGE